MEHLTSAAAMLSGGGMILFLLIAAAAIGIAAAIIGNAVRSAKWNRWLEAVEQTPQRYSVGAVQSAQEYDKVMATRGGIPQKKAEQIAESLYHDLMQARQLKSLANVRTGLMDECCAEWNALIQADSDAGRIHMERPVTEPIVRIAGWIPYDGNAAMHPHDGFDPLSTALDRAIVLQILVRAREYEIDAQSSKVIGGSARQESFLMYECLLVPHSHCQTELNSTMTFARAQFEWDAAVFRRMNPQVSDHRFVR